MARASVFFMLVGFVLGCGDVATPEDNGGSSKSRHGDRVDHGEHGDRGEDGEVAEGYHLYPMGDANAVYPHPLAGSLPLDILPLDATCTLDVFLIQLAVLGWELKPNNDAPTRIPDFNGRLILEDETGPFHPLPGIHLPFHLGDDDGSRGTVFILDNPATGSRGIHITGRVERDRWGEVTRWLTEIHGGRDSFTSISSTSLTIENLWIHHAEGIPVAAVSAGGDTTIRNNKITDVYPGYSTQLRFYNAFGIAFNGVVGSTLGYSIEGELRIENNTIDMNESGLIDYTGNETSPGVFGAGIATVFTNAEIHITGNDVRNGPIGGIIMLDSAVESHINGNTIDSQTAGFSPFIGFAPLGIAAGSYFAPRTWGARVKIRDNAITCGGGMSAGIVIDASVDVRATRNEIEMNDGFSAVVLYTGPTGAPDPAGDVSGSLVAHNTYQGSAHHLYTVAHLLTPGVTPGIAYDNRLVITRRDVFPGRRRATAGYTPLSDCDVYLPSGDADPIGSLFSYGAANNNRVVLGRLNGLSVCDAGEGNTVVGMGR